MGRLNDFLVKESADSTSFADILHGMGIGQSNPNPEVDAQRAELKRQAELLEQYGEQLTNPSQPIPAELRDWFQKLGWNVDDLQSLPKFTTDLPWRPKVKALDMLKTRARNAAAALANGTPATPVTTSSAPVHPTTTTAQPAVPADTPSQGTLNLGEVAASKLIIPGEEASVATPQPAQPTQPVQPTQPAQPAPTPKQPAAPQGLTREETMQLLQQGYMPTSTGGFMNFEEGAAQMLAKMKADKDETYNPGAAITDAKRLDKIRNKMLGNFAYTTAGHQLQADADLLMEAEAYERMRNAKGQQHQAGVDAYRNKLRADAEQAYLKQGENEYMRSVASNAPMSEAAQFYQQYSNAQNNETQLPTFNDSVYAGIDEQVNSYAQKNAPQYGRQGQVTYRNPNYITGDEVMRSTQGNRANTVRRWASELSDERRAKAREYIQARKEHQAALEATHAAKGGEYIKAMQDKTQSMRKSIENGTATPQYLTSSYTHAQQSAPAAQTDPAPAVTSPAPSTPAQAVTPPQSFDIHPKPATRSQAPAAQVNLNRRKDTTITAKLPDIPKGISKSGSMNKLASQMLEKAQEFIEENPGLITGLAASGGLGALGGAALTNVDEDDSAGEKFKKRLKNALLTGGLAAGAFGAVNYGANKIQNALPEDDVSPISAAVHSSPVRLLGIGTGAGIGAAIQGKDSKNAISEVFGNKHVSKDMLVDILNNPSQHSSALTKIKGVWHDPGALKDWVERTGIDTSKLVDPEFSNMAAYTDEATDMLNKNKALKDIADKINITPDKLAKWRLAAKRNKYLLGAAGAGLLLPEGLSTVGDLVGRLFGSSLHE